MFLSIFYLYRESYQFMPFGKMAVIRQNAICIVYVIESAVYGVLFTSCLCQKPERARAFDTQRVNKTPYKALSMS